MSKSKTFFHAPRVPRALYVKIIAFGAVVLAVGVAVFLVAGIWPMILFACTGLGITALLLFLVRLTDRKMRERVFLRIESNGVWLSQRGRTVERLKLSRLARIEIIRIDGFMTTFRLEYSNGSEAESTVPGIYDGQLKNQLAAVVEAHNVQFVDAR